MKKIKNYFLNKNTPSEASSKDLKVWPTSGLVILDESQVSVLKCLPQWADRLGWRKEEAFEAIVMTKDEKAKEQFGDEYLCISYKDLTWNAQWKQDHVRTLLSRDFDLQLNLFTHYNPLSSYIALSTDAGLRVAVDPDKESFFDLCINAPVDEEAFMTELVKYLTILLPKK